MITKKYDTLPQCAKDIRINVFIKEQGFQEEFDELDGISNHLVTFDGDKPCATVRFYEQDGIYYIGRLAVLKEYRSKHLGAKIVNEAEKIIKEKGGRAVKLAVSGAFHTPYMKEASEELEKALKTMTINAPQTEIYANRTGKPYPQDIAQIIETIALQASSSVRFEDTLKNMWADGIDTFIEVGAGKTLTGFVKKTLPEAKMYTVTTVDALNEAIENIKAGE